MRVAITGTRKRAQAAALEGSLRSALEKLDPQRDFLILGDASGIDALALRICAELGLTYIEVKADWKHYGRGAGPIRNGQMLDLGPEVVWWFHPSLSESKGTANCVMQAQERSIPTRGWGGK